MPLLGGVVVFLLPWTVWLTVTLPAKHVAEHWDAAWVGFDLAEVLALSLTAYGLWKRSPWVEVAASAAGTLLIADAWFDILLSGGDEKVWVAVAEAVVAEVPLAILCFWIAIDVAVTRERKNTPPLMARDLRDDVRRSAEPVQPERFGVARQPQRAVPDEARA